MYHTFVRQVPGALLPTRYAYTARYVTVTIRFQLVCSEFRIKCEVVEATM
jgi:hypothetical protein